MPAFKVTTPDGKSYKVTAANPEEANATVSQMHAEQGQPPADLMGDLSKMSSDPATMARNTEISNQASVLQGMQGGGDFAATNMARDAAPGLSDELAGIVNIPKGLMRGQGIGEGYNRGREAYQLAQQRMRAANPSASTKGDIIGGIGMMGGIAPGAAVPSLANQIGTGAALGGIQSAAEGDGLGDRAIRGLEGGAIGGAVGGVVGGAASLAGRLGTKAAPGAANEAVQASERLGVPLPRVVASDSRAAQMAGQGVGSTFAGAPIRRATEALDTNLGTKAEEIAGMGGAGGAKASVGDDARNALNDYITNKSPAKVSAAYDAFKAGPGTNLLPETAKTAQALMDRNAAAGAGKSGAAEFVMEAVTRPKGLTFQGMQDLRTQLRAKTSQGMLPEGWDKNQANQLYDALTQDLKAASTSGNGGAAAWDNANRLAAKEANLKKKLVGIVGKEGDKSGEQVYAKLVSAAQTGGRADLALLGRAKMAMPSKEWENIGASFVQNLGRTPEGAFSPARFSTEYGKLTDAGKQHLFAPEMRRALDDIHTIAQKAKDSAKFRNYSGTANAIGALGLIPTMLTNPVATLSGALGANVMARVLSKPATTRAAAGWIRALSAFGRGASRTSGVALQAANRQLAASVARELGNSNLTASIEQQLLGANPGTLASH